MYYVSALDIRCDDGLYTLVQCRKGRDLGIGSLWMILELIKLLVLYIKRIIRDGRELGEKLSTRSAQ